MDSGKDNPTTHDAKVDPARDDTDDKGPADDEVPGLDMSDDDMPGLEDSSHDDDVPPLVDYDDLPGFLNFGKKPVIEQQYEPTQTHNGRFPYFTVPIFMCYAHDGTFRLPASTVPETDPVLVEDCRACHLGNSNREHEGEVWRKAERPRGEYLEWQPCAGQRQMQPGFRTDGEGVERAWAFGAPLPIAKPVVLRAKL
ncbi:hypothetical protein C8R47DRAFT_1223270 [Mycena vitilis]|nr:hypothetical protein C8R47DRAFT_1223270 [Mycena vitilis]